jgi:glyoxylase-like metal-dependent hydrolase (beta-lactamase superfamily II)
VFRSSFLARSFLAIFAIFAIFGTCRKAEAAAPFHHDQVPGYYRLQVGAFEVTVLQDGGVPINVHLMRDYSGDIDKILAHSLIDPHAAAISINEWLVNTGKKLVLIDAGTGDWWGGPSTGKMLENLRAAGYTPAQVDTIFLTHLHTDHIGGLTTRSGQRVFPNAEIYAPKADCDYWLSAAKAASAPKGAKSQFQAAKAISAPYIAAGKWHAFSGNAPIVKGITPVPIPGHTPGHTGYEISSNGQTLMIVGDLIHVAAVQLAHPEVSLLWDYNQQEAVSERELLLNRFAKERTLIAGAHITYPGVGRVLKHQAGYVWVPIEFKDNPFKG